MLHYWGHFNLSLCFKEPHHPKIAQNYSFYLRVDGTAAFIWDVWSSADWASVNTVSIFCEFSESRMGAPCLFEASNKFFFFSFLFYHQSHWRMSEQPQKELLSSKFLPCLDPGRLKYLTKSWLTKPSVSWLSTMSFHVSILKMFHFTLDFMFEKYKELSSGFYWSLADNLKGEFFEKWKSRFIFP